MTVISRAAVAGGPTKTFLQVWGSKMIAGRCPKISSMARSSELALGKRRKKKKRKKKGETKV
jgi:hypothetical protein